jgi:hypothetical protein
MPVPAATVVISQSHGLSFGTSTAAASKVVAKKAATAAAMSARFTTVLPNRCWRRPSAGALRRLAEMIAEAKPVAGRRMAN